MTKGAMLVRIVLAALALLGLVTLSVNVAFNFGWLDACTTSRQWSVTSPHAAGVASITIAECRSGGSSVRVWLDSAGRKYQLLSARAKAPPREVRIEWRSARHLQLQYPRDMDIEFPPDLGAVSHRFGDVEVSYATQ